MTKTNMSKEDILKGIECCAEFLCGECPYQKYDDPAKGYTLRCIHTLLVDINDLVKKDL